MGEVAHDIVDRRDAGAAVDGALADIASRIDPQAHEHGGAARPLFEHVAGEVAAGEHGRCEVRRFGDSVIAATARSIASGAAAGSIADSAGAGPGASEWCRALRRRGALARSFACRDLRDRRDDEFRLGRFDGRGFALDIGRGRGALFFFGLRLDFLLRWGRGRRRWWLPQIENAHHALRSRQVQLPGEIQEGVQQRGVDRDDRCDRRAFVLAGDDLSVSHGPSTPSWAERCGDGPNDERRVEGDSPGALTRDEDI